MKATIKDIEIDYEMFGEGTPILFLHGNALDKISMKHSYEPIFQTISGYRRIYVDLPGMGDSHSSLSINSTDDMLDVLLAFIQQVIGHEDILLFGHSYGGYLSLGIMNKLQDRVKGAYLTCPVVIGQFSQRRVEQQVPIIEEEVHTDTSTSEYQNYLSMNIRINAKTWELYQQLIVPGVRRADHDFMDRIQREGQQYYRYALEEQLSLHHNTVLHVLLGKMDNVVGYQDQIDFFTKYSYSTTTILGNSGHNLFIDVAEDNHEWVTHFLNKVNQQSSN
ncbi:pimeloyl-ACP methyl ester carboxylesterase [Paenibacillus sp. SORGH_AS306]|uniref:alpha/beta hydrolase n=1 Tax=unclassified Paenibacillus TaxID=185978 RepID=UPI002782D337|nr:MULTISPECIES: alpha/beta hydrolase [unclassified Paenibacillus]MDQ1232594.1 pimeloyl-ACP methyl ester carboxylesterase [Paenibacillus sp. SORGH_AS_0306]MDR6109646.1 pimeloyl-ACP methyl ester carboxylesterase [Paenibacillus sp. SORGH_AS_0338]